MMLRFFIYFFILIILNFLYDVSCVNFSKSRFGNLAVNKKFLRKAARGAIMQKYMDTTVNPCDDFYEYACGNWPKVNPKQRDFASYDTIKNVENKITDYIIQLLNESANTTLCDALDYEMKAKKFYRSCVNSNIFQYRKIEEYTDVIKSIGGFPALSSDWDFEKFEWVNMIAHMKTYGVEVFVSETVFWGQDKNDTDTIQIQEAEVGLLALTKDDNSTSRDYMLNELLIKRLLKIYGVANRKASKVASNIMKFMIKLLAVVDADDEYKEDSNYEPEKSVPQINWDEYFSITFGKPFNKSMEVLIMTPKYLQRLPALILRSDFETVANYIAVKFLYDLHVEFGHNKFPEKMCAALVQEYMEPVVESMYIKRFYDKQTENEIIEMIADIKDSFKTILKQCDWLDRRTKRKALRKLNALTYKVGLTEYILTTDELHLKYQNLSIDPDNYYQNNLNFRYYKNFEEHNIKTSLTEKEKVDLDVNTVEVNAYYVPETNMMIIPAGIILPPFYHKDLPKAYNYGNTGYTIGHELTHGFDNDGRNYDAYGAEVDWWSKSSSDSYQKRAECMIAQYNNYTMPGLAANIDGNLTLGENIADNGGVRESYYAYKKWFERNADQDIIRSETLPGLNMTNTQLFFLSFAQGSCDHLTQSDLKRLADNEHAISKYRIIGSLSNFEEFSKEFNCPLGSHMNPAHKCRVW